MTSADTLVSSLEGLKSGSFANEVERVRARDALYDALRRVQSPWDIAWEQNWVNPATNACVKTLIDAGIFAKWVELGSKPMTAAELARLVGADELLIKRMMRQISGQHLITEVGEDEYAATPWVNTLATDKAFPSLYGGFYGELNAPMFRTLPYFLKETGFKNPTDVNNSNFQYMTESGSNFFQYVGSNQKLTSPFNDAMECHSKYNLTPWPEVYPTETLVKDAKPDRPIVVDMGGGKGHDLEKFSQNHPDVPQGSLVLQDLPDILKDVKPSDAITVQPHDFFTPQPVKGARAYFMHNVLHDWEDEQAIKVLKNIAAAMEKGYSKLLVHESLISATQPSARVTTSDITVMACLSAKERTESEWNSVFEQSGLRVVKIWKAVQAVESVIEAELQ